MSSKVTDLIGGEKIPSNTASHTGFVGLALLGIVLSLSVPDRKPSTERVRGVTLDARRAPPPGLYDELRELGVNQVALVPYAFFRDGELRFNPDARWFSESSGGARSLADSLRARGIGITIKPQVWMGNERFPGDLDFPNEAGWEAFEEDYRNYALHHAGLAADVKADWLVVGTELARSAIERPEFWRALIREVRTVFPGRITYAANWWAEVDSVQFWDELDLIGVQAYYPLADSETDDLVTIAPARWRSHSRGLERLSRRWKKPIVFTEIGYRSMPDAAVEPWAWTPRRGDGEPDDETQAALYRAFFDGPWKSPWMAGAYIWKWYGDGPSPRHALDFTPQGKSSEGIIREAFRAAQ